MTLDGRCHCGQLSLRFAATREPSQLGSRACACTFCAPRHLRWTSDPAGSVAIVAANASRYTFGTATAAMLVCPRCGFAIAALDEATSRAVVNIDVLARAAEFAAPSPMDFDGESLADRLARRARTWTPASLT